MPLRQVYPDPSANPSDTPSAQVDIIAVHGLNPYSKDEEVHGFDTWRAPDGPTGRLWLSADLPQVAPKARVFLFIYDSSVVYGKDRSTFVDKANDLLETIRLERRGAEKRPIIFLGHSMGGLLIKQALIQAHSNLKYTPIKEATSGLAFFATPHRGGGENLVALGGTAARMALLLGFQKGDNVVETLEKGSIFSDIMQDSWKQQLLQYEIVSFWGSLDNIVPRESARFGLPGEKENIVTLKADHSGVCKFGDSQADKDNLKKVEGNIQDLYETALKQGELLSLPAAQEPASRGNTYSSQGDLWLGNQFNAGNGINFNYGRR